MSFKKTISKELISLVALLSILLLTTYCTQPSDKANRPEDRVKVVKLITDLPKTVSHPKDNPGSIAKVELGRLLFFDPILSGNKDVACASCHHPNHGYTEYLDISIGVNGHGLSSKRKFVNNKDIPFVKRNSQSILNTAFNGINSYSKYDPEQAPMFWDARVTSLEHQALEPIKALEEMRGRNFSEDEILDEVVSRLQGISEYRQLFEEAFGNSTSISAEHIGMAIASFERTLITNNSRFDQYLRGDKTAISISEKEGYELFQKVGCDNCHNGPMFSDYEFHVLGVPENEKLPQPDSGIDKNFSFRTASLRNLRFTAPYMHSGKFNSLKEVLEFYEDISFGKTRNPHVTKEQFDPLVRELELAVKDMAPIISFLNTLNDDNFDRTIPATVPSGLSVGGNIM